MNPEINLRVKKFRNYAGLSQEQVAKKLGIKTTTYSQMERSGNISAEKITRLAKIFGVSPIELLYGEDEINPLALEHRRSNTLVFHQGSLEIDENGNFVFPEYAPTKREIDFLKAIKSLSKSDQQEVLDFVQQKLSKK